MNFKAPGSAGGWLLNTECILAMDQNQDTRKAVNYLVGVTGFEPATSASRRQRSTRLSYTPMGKDFQEWRFTAKRANPTSASLALESASSAKLAIACSASRSARREV